MNGDFSRDTSGPARLARFTRVLLQQGRPLLDAEFNEQSAIHHDFLRTMVIDLMGRGWRPAPGQFSLAKPVANGFTITQGHFYVDGILCDNPADCSYALQPFLPHPPEIGNAHFLVYVECRERHVNALQRPALREPALGGPDTASRAQIIWQVRTANAAWIGQQNALLAQSLGARLAVAAEPEKSMLAAFQGTLPGLANNLTGAIGATTPLPADVTRHAQAWFDAAAKVPPRLRAMAGAIAGNDEACAMAPEARYRGRENQLYRVEVHQGSSLGNARPTFKWSRENGSVMFAVRTGQAIASGAPDNGRIILTIALDSLGHDRRDGICVGDWVEAVSEPIELDQLSPPLGKIVHVDRSKRSVQVDVADEPGNVFGGCRALRRWDQSTQLDHRGTIALTETDDDQAPWIALELGIQVQFQPGGLYLPGDYWMIPARVAGGVQWPHLDGKPAFAAADGVARHRAPIGYASMTGGGFTLHDAGRTMQS